MKGWIGSDIKTNAGSRSVSNKTVEVTFTIIESFRGPAGRSALRSSRETYHTIFTLNRDEDDPIERRVRTTSAAAP